MTALKKQRNGNMDLLRIVSMLLIVFLHSIDHSGVLENAENCGTAMYFYVRFAYALCQVCVNIYILLSGYFMINSKFRLQKLVVLWLETVFYTLVFKIVFVAVGLDNFSITALASSFFPFLTGRYWFLTIYVGMYLLSPFMNLLIRTMNKKQHSLLCIILFVLFSLWISIHPSIAGMNSGGGWGLPWFVVLYLTAAWFRLYYKPSGKSLVYFAAFLAIPLLVGGLQVLANQLGVGIVQTMLSQQFRYDSVPAYCMTLCLFVGFLNVQIKTNWLNKAICAVAPLTLGVYLIHAHANVSPWLWETLALPGKMDSFLFLPFQWGIVLSIFAVCIGIDAVRKATIGRLENAQFLQAACDKIQGKAVAIIQKSFKE